MWIIQASISEFNYYLAIYRNKAELNGLKDNAIVYPSWAEAVSAIDYYKYQFEAKLEAVQK